MCMTVYMFTNYEHANEINTRRPTTDIRVDRLTRQSLRRLCPRREADRDFLWGTELFRIPGMEAHENRLDERSSYFLVYKLQIRVHTSRRELF
jgi:hypothetical protein